MMPSLILIADDYEDNRELLRLMLAGAKYEIIEASDGQECVELADQHLPDLIVVDLSMPKLDGWKVFETLRANPRTNAIPCIAATAYAKTDRIKALQAGFSAYVTKPFDTAELLLVVGNLLRKASLKVNRAEVGEAALATLDKA